MRKLRSYSIAASAALLALLPGVVLAKLAANHNQTRVRIVPIAIATATALLALLPGVGLAKLAANHNQTRL